MADQFRYDATGLNGGWIRTPFLDRIASEGVNFTNCYTTSPVCMPARVSMATGLYPHNINLWTNRRYMLPMRTSTWTEIIKEQGYRTSIFGKTHLYTHSVKDLRDQEELLRSCGLDVIDEIAGPRAAARVMSYMTERWKKIGFLEKYRNDYRDRFSTKPHVVRPSVLPLEEYADVYVAQRAKSYLKQYNDKEPWFCWLSFGGPHEPWDTPEPYASLYEPGSIPEPIMPEGELKNRPRGHLDVLLGTDDGANEYRSSVESKDDAPNHSPEFEDGDIAKLRADYAGNVTLIDDQIGEVLQVIEDRGELQNTVIVFTSDHGEMNGDFGLLYKDNFFDSAVKVPLIVRTPASARGAMGGTNCSSFVEWFDVGPTLVEFAGSRVTFRQFAQSLVPILSNTVAVHREDALSEIWGEHMIVNERWKMAINTDGKPYMLFDLKEDPLEQKNLAGSKEYREVEDGLRLRILERIASSYVNEGSAPLS
jgi:choline-sulfatase